MNARARVAAERARTRGEPARGRGRGRGRGPSTSDQTPTSYNIYTSPPAVARPSSGASIDFVDLAHDEPDQQTPARSRVKEEIIDEGDVNMADDFMTIAPNVGTALLNPIRPTVAGSTGPLLSTAGPSTHPGSSRPTNLTERIDDLQQRLDAATEHIAKLEKSVEFYSRSQEVLRQQLVNCLNDNAVPQDIFAKVTALENRLGELEEYTYPTAQSRR